MENTIHMDCGCILADVKPVADPINTCESHLITQNRILKESTVRSALEAVMAWHEFNQLLKDAKEGQKESFEMYEACGQSGNKSGELEAASTNAKFSRIVHFLVKLAPLYERI